MSELTDALKRAAAQLRKEAAESERRKTANTARVAAAMLGLEHFKRIIEPSPGATS